MPTVILIETTYSMNSSVRKYNVEPYKPLPSAVSGLCTLLDQIGHSSRLEFVCLVTYSNQLEVLVQFTRDLEMIKTELLNIRLTDKFNLIEAMKSVEKLILMEWGSGIPCNPSFKVTDFDYATYTVDNNLEICGFIELKHLGSPAAVSRHLVLPYTHPSHGKAHAAQRSAHSSGDVDDEPLDEGHTPSFCVLLHGALKVENMAALCQVGNNWYGVLFSWADSKKKSNLMLSLLEPGRDSIPWLGDLNALHIPSEPPPEEDAFPVKPPDKKSYSQNGVVWIRQGGIQSDIQKILRHARKIPEKTQQFYKELNRVRRAAICVGFLSLIDGLAAILDRECTLLPSSTHPACAIQLTHAAQALRDSLSKDHKYIIAPMKMSF
ncbi:unnamed protein product [Nesidiocoris tenuis]|uniref:Integrator complex subunit 14 n=1 Tax=Nesidiocoris tenuis TaxID=355587 RepID=A0A6H5G873_9HEMI|nr:unnamed protein product [Nesidiocoris tenuis]